VTTRWLSNIYLWQCRIMMLTSAVHEVLAFLIFFQAVASHRPLRGIPKPWESWIVVVIAASLGLLVSLMLNLGASIQMALHASSPALNTNSTSARQLIRKKGQIGGRTFESGFGVQALAFTFG
jgi:hypothetical protein